MKAVDFREVNAEFAKDQKEFQTLPAHIDESGAVTSCFELSFKERDLVLETGLIWLTTQTDNKPLQPILLSIEKPVLSLFRKGTRAYRKACS